MAVSLGFHIVFAALGIGLPLMLVFTEFLAIRRHDDVWMALTRRWSKALGILVAVGRGLRHGAVVRPRSVLARPDGAMGLRDRAAVRARGVRVLHRGDLHRDLPLRLGPAHAAGRTGARDGRSCSAERRARGSWSRANAWMQSPVGFELSASGKVVDVQPIQAMLNPSTPVMTTHMILAGVHGDGAHGRVGLRGRRCCRARRDLYHRRALAVGLHVRAGARARAGVRRAIWPRSSSPSGSR